MRIWPTDAWRAAEARSWRPDGRLHEARGCSMEPNGASSGTRITCACIQRRRPGVAAAEKAAAARRTKREDQLLTRGWKQRRETRRDRYVTAGTGVTAASYLRTYSPPPHVDRRDLDPVIVPVPPPRTAASRRTSPAQSRNRRPPAATRRALTPGRRRPPCRATYTLMLPRSRYPGKWPAIVASSTSPGGLRRSWPMLPSHVAPTIGSSRAPPRCRRRRRSARSRG